MTPLNPSVPGWLSLVNQVVFETKESKYSKLQNSERVFII